MFKSSQTKTNSYIKLHRYTTYLSVHLLRNNWLRRISLVRGWWDSILTTHRGWNAIWSIRVHHSGMRRQLNANQNAKAKNKTCKTGQQKLKNLNKLNWRKKYQYDKQKQHKMKRNEIIPILDQLIVEFPSDDGVQIPCTLAGCIQAPHLGCSIRGLFGILVSSFVPKIRQIYLNTKKKSLVN